MKKFIYSFLAFSILVVALYALLVIIYLPKNSSSNDYLSAIIDKHNRINEIKGPKVIFAGGSNLAFGLNSETVQQEFSVPVVNLGLHARLGLDFLINELKSTIKKGDVVFLSIEYLLSVDGDYKLKCETSKYLMEAKSYYSYDVREEIMMNIDNTRKAIKKDKNEKFDSTIILENLVYSRKSFNKFGDVTVHLNITPPKSLRDRENLTYHYWDGIDKLNNFYNYAQSKNVEVFFLYPCYSEVEYKKNKAVINRISEDISRNLNIEVLNTPSDFVFSDSLFFDTVYHLNKQGREERTRKLIALLKNNLKVQNRLIAIKSVY